MDKRIRLNDICIIGLPRCDFVFSSTRNCFIGFGFKTSNLEMQIIQSVLERRQIQPIEASGPIAPAQNAFCAKICSKIITSQFCVMLVNNDIEDGKEIPNANVCMEYGLALGFNKYVIPFQRNEQQLPFNVAGLDTVKYTNENFLRKAEAAIDQAIADTQQTAPGTVPIDEVLETFLLSKQALLAPLRTEPEKIMHDFGQPLGLKLLNDFAGIKLMYLANYSALRSEAVVWRLRAFNDLIQQRTESLGLRVAMGVVNPPAAPIAKAILEATEVWVIVSSDSDKTSVLEAVRQFGLKFKVAIFSLTDVEVSIGSVPK